MVMSRIICDMQFFVYPESSTVEEKELLTGSQET